MPSPRLNHRADSTPSLIDAQSVQSVWKSYKAQPTQMLRNRLLEHYLPVVQYNAERSLSRLPSQVELDDLISAGVMGLKDAIEAFDPGRKIKFETFCTMRVRGAMMDELRAMDWVPRLVRSRSQKYREASSSLEAELGRNPTQNEVAKRLGLDAHEFGKLLGDAKAANLISLQGKTAESEPGRETTFAETLPDSHSTTPQQEIHKRDLLEVITRGLNRAERLVLILYYYEEMTMKEIGATLDLSESRVSQMHSSILAQLRQNLEHRKKELVA